MIKLLVFVGHPSVLNPFTEEKVKLHQKLHHQWVAAMMLGLRNCCVLSTSEDGGGGTGACF